MYSKSVFHHPVGVLENRESVVDPEFPIRGGDANLQGGGANLLFGQIFPKNCKKLKKIGPRGRV